MRPDAAPAAPEWDHPSAAWLDRLVTALCRQQQGTFTQADAELLGRAAPRPLAGGANNRVYEVGTGADEQRYCLKLYRTDGRDRADREHRALRILTGRPHPLVPTPLLARPGPPQPALLMTILAGRPLGGKSLTAAQLLALAKALDGLYELTPASIGEPVPPVVTGARRMLTRVQDCWATLPIPGRLRWLRDAWQAWQAGPDPALLGLPAPLVFGRGDPSLANCLWDGTQVRLVDLEYSGWTDRAFELADLVEHPQSRATPDAAWQQLVTRLLRTDDDYRRYLAARRVLCFFWLARLWPDPDLAPDSASAPSEQPDLHVPFARQVGRAAMVLSA